MSKKKETDGKTAVTPAVAAPGIPKVKIPKLAPKNKTRLPRRQKKALAKEAARKAE
jgi:hypothetical protein